MNIVDIQHVTKEYASHKALDDVSIEIPKGSIFGLLGPNGAGKTSLIRIVNQITGPDKGQIFFDGKLLNEGHIARIGYLPEERGLYRKMKVGDQLLYLAQLKGLSKQQAMDRLKGWFVKFEIKSWWDKTIADLSKGMQQKVQFVSTVLHEPDLIILDEPFSGFDPINANLIRDEILELRQKGSTIIFSTHRMETVEELCDNIALIHKSKKVLDGPKSKLKEQFKTNTFSVEYKGQLNGMIPQEDIRQTIPLEDGYTRTSIHVPAGRSSNDLLRELISQVEIRSFGENIPSMSEIFMRAVNEVPEA
ncbi:ABC-2 type transport system ATP-binding protein [Dyadobacter jejuensis]|uniref:ABC-2 type transport system ATP-binding protein n=1 Tax=Dyadobacter jejuensis TaxID=1082580 RepID=A0A316AP93_9BACT|nr:ATP-binding cassette domain-containing protein [Dyadobacter jejuensis]PWJ59236.1 ABC-2 type transport system ATP-binding protein [Dyadobacter jejuensis]